MSGPPPADTSERIRREDKGRPCRRCGGRAWDVETRPKGILRRIVETAFAVPDVLIYQSESGGWPAPVSEFWTCRNCGRRVRA